MAIDIVRATESHIPDIVELWIEFMEHHKDIDPRFPMKDDAHTGYEQHLTEQMEVENTLVLVALDESRVVGYSVSLVNKYPPIWVERQTYGFIDTMVIKSDYRRRGVGEQMLNRIFEWLTSRDTDMVELSVSARNLIGYSFWKKHGFRDYIHRLYLDRK
jgi:ribosomal protein S18 acetylase RimI-like enzyme